MIDTIVVLLDQSQFKIFKHEKFFPNADKILDPLYHMGGSYAQARQNPTKLEMKMGIYKPRLTLTKRLKSSGSYEIILKIEYSVPKLLFGNNFDELDESDIIKATEKLEDILNQMGVYTTIKDIENARIGAIHYSKNIPLTDYTSPSMYLHELSKLNMNKKLDVNQTDFRNGGHSLKYRTNKREIVFYDKMKDLQQAQFSEKRAEENDNAIQLNLFSERKMQKQLGVLRMEVRLGDMSNIRKSLLDAGVQADVVYKDLCRLSVAKAILQSYWKQIRNSYIPVFSAQDMKPEDYFIMLIRNNSQVSKMRLLSYVGIRAIVETIGTHDLKNILQSFGFKGWSRLVKDMKDIKISQESELMEVIDVALTSFIPLRLIDFGE